MKPLAGEEASSSPNPNDPIIVTAVGGGRRKVVSRGVSILDFVLRVIAAGGTLGSAIAMGTTDETLFLNQNFQIRAQYNDLPSLTFFVIANSVVFGYLVLSLPASIFHIFKPAAKSSRIILVIFDTVMLAIVTAAASAATSIVYLAHKGNLSANWASACQQLDTFCKRISGSLVGSFGAALVFMPIIITSVIAISRS